MNAVGIDVSKGKSMVAIMRPFGEIVSAPFEIKHTASDIPVSYTHLDVYKRQENRLSRIKSTLSLPSLSELGSMIFVPKSSEAVLMSDENSFIFLM